MLPLTSAGAMTIDAPVVKNENAAFGAKRVSDGVTKNPDKLKVNDPNHKLEGQVFDKSEFPYADDSSGYGTPRVIPVHSEKDEAYNKEMNKGENVFISSPLFVVKLNIRIQILLMMILELSAVEVI